MHIIGVQACALSSLLCAFCYVHSWECRNMHLGFMHIHVSANSLLAGCVINICNTQIGKCMYI